MIKSNLVFATNYSGQPLEQYVHVTMDYQLWALTINTPFSRFKKRIR